MLDVFNSPLLSTLASAFVLGLLGGAHCIGMCGGLMAAMGFSVADRSPARSLTLLLSYNAGRIGSYALMGGLAGWLGWSASSAGLTPALRWLAGALLVAMGLYIADWWRGLTYLERLGAKLWKPVQSLSRHFLPVRHAGNALILGMLWGWLPCGLVYSMLAYAFAQAAPSQAAWVMLAFGLGTMPSLLLAGAFAERFKRLLQRRQFKWAMGFIIIVFGVWTIYGGLGHGHHAQRSGNSPSQSVDHQGHHGHH